VTLRELVLELVSEPPPALPTSVPPYDPAIYASAGYGAERLFVDNVVLEQVPNVSWSEAKLEYEDLRVLRAIDGVSPVLLLESLLAVPREQLRSILFLLLSRGIVAVTAPERERLATSGVVRRGAEEPVEAIDLFSTG
jgi:hypothetical protein